MRLGLKQFQIPEIQQISKNPWLILENINFCKTQKKFPDFVWFSLIYLDFSQNLFLPWFFLTVRTL